MKTGHATKDTNFSKHLKPEIVRSTTHRRNTLNSQEVIESPTEQKQFNKSQIFVAQKPSQEPKGEIFHKTQAEIRT